MDKPYCRRCGNKSLVRNYISLKCPVCGEYIYLTDARDAELWSEHKIGLMFKRGGWNFIELIEPPRWFFECVI